MRRLLPTAALLALSLTGCAGQGTPATATGHTTAGRVDAAASHRARARKLPALTRHAARVAVPRGTLALITEPQAGIAPLQSAIAGARRQVELVMYEDEDAQIDAALEADERRGVSVRVLLNGGYYGGGSSQNEAAYSYLQAHHVPVRWTPSYFALTHQKTLIVDNRAYILTFNLTPQYYASSRDFAVVDSNPADVTAIERTFDADYNQQRVSARTGSDLVWSPGSQTAQVNLINSASGWLDIYNEEMDSAAVEQALAGDARRGVDVRVTMTADDSWSEAFAQLAGAGVHIRTYAASAPLYIHAKMILTPRAAFVGSQNFSTTSMNYNRELGLVTRDGVVRTSLRATFNHDYASATPYKPASSGGGAHTGGQSGCTVTAEFSPTYHDYDVYVHTHAPDAGVTVTDTAGHTAAWHTDSSGYADVYLKTGAPEPGQMVTATVAGATCKTTL